MLSVVIVGRNDNYGGDFLSRINAFGNVFLDFASTYKLDAELIVVEWNPPKDRLSLAEVLQWPENHDGVEVKVITVPEKYHALYAQSTNMPMFEFIAKNVGVRHATRDFVLVTNPDILMSEELIAYLAKNTLQSDCFYRVDRYDFKGPSPFHKGAKKILHHAKNHTYRVHTREKNFKRNHLNIFPWSRMKGILTNRWRGTSVVGGEKVKKEKAVELPYNDDYPYHGIHTNASGDFLLASKQAWMKIRGFHETAATYTHLDSYACFQLKAVGLNQMFLCPPKMIFHADHHRQDNQNRPRVADQRWGEDLELIHAGKLGPVFNDENWGLENKTLDEIYL